jgi:two-component system response regulator FixJ
MPETRSNGQAAPPLIHVSGSAPNDVGRPNNLISVVDDDVWVGESMTELLDAYGLDALAYVSGADFLADERHKQACCLVIDQHMPEMDGLEVVQVLHDEGVFVPTILITGKLDKRISERAHQLGGVAVLEKPFAVARLVELVHAGLARSR